MFKKRALGIVLCMLLLVVIPVQAQAMQMRANRITPTLTFDGTAAICEITVSDFGKNISIDLELWNGNTLVAEWSKSGTSVVMVSETCAVTRGQTYELRVSGTVGAKSVSGSITATCP